MTFRDRTDAGRQLAGRLAGRLHGDLVVLALPRGGVPVAVPVARSLGAPLDVLVVRKLGAPGRPELAIGALAEGGVRVVDRDAVAALGVTPAQLQRVELDESAELERRAARYRAGAPAWDLSGATAVLVDDGLATGSSALAACRAARALGAAHVVVAVPVASVAAVEALRQDADDVVVVQVPAGFRSVGEHYEDFSQLHDDEVERQLRSVVHDRASAVHRDPARPA